MTYENSTLTTSKQVCFPPDGYCNFDGMAGADLGFKATLQRTHKISGPGFMQQRAAYGLDEEDKFAHVFVVPNTRFDQGWTACQHFQWSGEDEDDDEARTNRKRRYVKTFGRAGGKGVQTKKTTETKRIITKGKDCSA